LGKCRWCSRVCYWNSVGFSYVRNKRGGSLFSIGSDAKNSCGCRPIILRVLADELEKLTDFHRELVFKNFPAEAVKIEPNPGHGKLYRCGPRGELGIQSRLENGNPVDVICRCAQEIDADLVIVGSRGLGNVGALVLGSVSEKVVRKCSRTIMVVKDAVSDNSLWERIGNAPMATQHLTR
jgi:hypothetical protein